MTARLAGLAATVILVLLAGLAGAGPAAAHATRTGADPGPEAVLDRGPDRVSATFNEALQANFAAMTVVGPDGNLWSDGEPTVSGAVVSVPVRPLGPAGTYTVNYRVTSADGHPVSGSWTFRLSVASTGTPGPPVGARADGPAAAESGLAVWPFVVAAAAVVAGGAWWAVRRRS
ncbi:copper resistance CopC family protein [Mycolicibacterium grossiae]|nr:copper resistance CopC family protein [Mycolicibacterium grossiae]